MNDVKFIEYISCSECADKLNKLCKAKREFLKERAKLDRCKTCEKVKGITNAKNRER